MNILSIETSGSIGSIALISKDYSREKTLARGMHHGRDLVLAIDSLLAEDNHTLESLDAIVVDSGPGSYTGLRIGVITAKTLAFCKGKRLFALGSLDILVHNIPPAKAPACALIDAGQGEVYYCVYASRDRLWEKISDYALEKPQEVAGKIPRGATIIGDGIRRIENIISTGQFNIADEKIWRISALRAGELALRLCKSQKALSPFELQPLYMQRPMAETVWEKKC